MATGARANARGAYVSVGSPLRLRGGAEVEQESEREEERAEQGRFVEGEGSQEGPVQARTVLHGEWKGDERDAPV